jgi:hypothetical protein
VEEITSSDLKMNGHILNLHPEKTLEKESICQTSPRKREEVPLSPTGNGQGE